MPITNFSKHGLKLMVMRSGILLCGLWRLQGHVSANYSISKQNIYKSGILTIQQGRKDTPFVYPEELEHGGCEMAQRNRTYFRLHLSESVWTAHYYSWNSSQLKHFAEKYGMNKEVVYPHSFRHRYARISSKSTMTLHCLPTLWDTKASKQHEFTCAVPPANNRSLSIKS